MSRLALAVQQPSSNDDRHTQESLSLRKAKHQREENKMLDIWSVESTFSDNDEDRPASIIYHNQSMARSKRRTADPREAALITKRMSESHASNFGPATTDNKGTEAEEEQLLSLLQEKPTTLPRLSGRTIGACAKHRQSNVDSKHPEITDSIALASKSRPSCRLRAPYNPYRWSLEEDERLVDMLREGKGWHSIAIGLGRGYDQCRMRWRHRLQWQNPDLMVRFTKPRVKGMRRWTEEEDQLLVAMYAEGRSWECISKALPGRTLSMCRAQWRVILSTKHPDMPKVKQGISKTGIAEADEGVFQMSEKGKTWKSVSDTIPGYSDALYRARLHSINHKYSEVPKWKNVGPSASRTAERIHRLAAMYSQGNSSNAESRTFPSRAPKLCPRRWQILREKKKHPEMTPYSKCERDHALTGPRASENRIKKQNISDDDGVPAVEPVVSEKRLIADAAAEPLGKRIKLSISPEANTEHPENSTSMAQKATRGAAAQELESDSETTSEAYNDAVGRAWWIAFASEVLKEAQNTDHSRLEEDGFSVGDEEGKRWGEYFPSAQMAPHEPDDWTADDDNDNKTDDHEGSLIGGLLDNGQSQKSSSLSDVVSVSTPYDMTDLQTPSHWGSEEVEPVENESVGMGRKRYATPSPQALSPSQQLDSHTKALRHAGINLDCVELLAANGSVDIRHFKSESTNEYGRPFAMPKAAEARRRGLEALLRCAAQQDE